MSEELFVKDSPYRPPDAQLYREPASYREDAHGRGPGTLDPTQIDVGRAVRYPFSNPNWWKTALLVGVIQLVPLFGVVVSYGWLQRIFDEVRRGHDAQMPEASIGDDFGRGWRLLGALFVGWIAMMALMWGGMLVFVAGIAGVEAVFGSQAGGTAGGVAALAGMIPMVAVWFCLPLLMPDLIRRCFRGDWFGFLRWRKAVGLILGSPVPYLTLLAGMFVAVAMMYAGMFALYFGFFLTFPLGMAVAVHGMAQWDRYIEHQQSSDL